MFESRKNIAPLEPKDGISFVAKRNDGSEVVLRNTLMPEIEADSSMNETPTPVRSMGMGAVFTDPREYLRRKMAS